MNRMNSLNKLIRKKLLELEAKERNFKQSESNMEVERKRMEAELSLQQHKIETEQQQKVKEVLKCRCNR